jgi:O-methyltransferase
MSSESDRVGALYLDLLRRCLTRSAFPEKYRPYTSKNRVRRALARVAMAFASRPLELVRRVRFDPYARREGLDWPPDAETMIGEKRLVHLQGLVEDVVRRDVSGDLMETGVWRGGAVILMRAALEVFGDRTRSVFAADSFQGLPPPDPARYPADLGLDLHRFDELAVSLDTVKSNLARYGWLDDRVKFVVGWFEESLPTAPVERLAILRLDGDLYASTTHALDALYPKVSTGGYVVIDDYSIDACRRATHDYRDAHGITEPIERIDTSGVFWRRDR